MLSGGRSSRPSTTYSVPQSSSSTSLNSESIDPWSEELTASTSSHQHTSASNTPLSTSNSLRRRQRLQIDTASPSKKTTPHPLDHETALPGSARLGSNAVEVGDDVSRPALRRLTSETERQVEESRSSEGGSLRGSFDMLRMSSVEPNSSGEVEVLIHRIKEGESLPGIALLYGIDLPVLRKTNKLWPSDPVYLRTHLYVPLEACKWNKASESLIRGPGEGQVTLIPKNMTLSLPSSSKGKEIDPAERRSPRGSKYGSTEDLLDLASPVDSMFPGYMAGGNEWEGESAKSFMPATNNAYDRITPLRGVPPTAAAGGRNDALSQEEEEDTSTPRILDVVRIPSSQLRFFPRAQSGRHDVNDTRRSMDEVDQAITSRRDSSTTEGGSIQNNLNILPRHLQSKTADPPNPPPPPKSKMVKLRPPQATLPKSTSSTTLTSRLASLFDVPPPPLQPPYGTLPHPPPSSSRPRLSTDSVPSPRLSRRSSAASSHAGRQPEVLLELHTRSSKETIKPNAGRGTRKME